MALYVLDDLAILEKWKFHFSGLAVVWNINGKIYIDTGLLAWAGGLGIYPLKNWQCREHRLDKSIKHAWSNFRCMKWYVVTWKNWKRLKISDSGTVHRLHSVVFIYTCFSHLRLTARSPIGPTTTKSQKFSTGAADFCHEWTNVFIIVFTDLPSMAWLPILQFLESINAGFDSTQVENKQ